MRLPFAISLSTCFDRADSVVESDSIRELRRALQDCQRRLGTSAEAPGDFDRARVLAHEINNRATIEYLRTMVPRTRPLRPICS